MRGCLQLGGCRGGRGTYSHIYAASPLAASPVDSEAAKLFIRRRQDSGERAPAPASSPQSLMRSSRRVERMIYRPGPQRRGRRPPRSRPPQRTSGRRRAEKVAADRNICSPDEYSDEASQGAQVTLATCSSNRGRSHTPPLNSHAAHGGGASRRRRRIRRSCSRNHRSVT